MIHSVTGQLVSTAVKMIASCEMDHRSVGFIHPRRSSFIDSNWPSRDFVSSSGVYNSNFYFLLRYAVFFFWKISPLHQLLLRGGSHRLLIENNEPFFLPSLSYYFTPAYIITSLAHRRFGIFLSNMTCGWEVDTNFKLFWCVTLLVFPISAGFSLPIHFTVFTNWRGGNEQFSELGY